MSQDGSGAESLTVDADKVTEARSGGNAAGCVPPLPQDHRLSLPPTAASADTRGDGVEGKEWNNAALTSCYYRECRIKQHPFDLTS